MTLPQPRNRALSREAESLLGDLAESLDIPQSRYEAAERSYKSVGDWLNRPASRLAKAGTTIYPQGSFRLGTAIVPIKQEDEYDLDVVCEIGTRKIEQSQADLKKLLGLELADYTRARSMALPEEARKCWTLNYSDSSQFHMDVLPAIPDGERQYRLVAAAGKSAIWSQTGVAITDIRDKNYRILSDDWPSSNPKGYSEWFRSRMKAVFDAKRQAIALHEARASVESIPEYRVKTPLQAAVQILKRHRDMRFFEDDDDIKPISIIITTLAAHAYGQETGIGAALLGILERMDRYIEQRNGVYWIENPSDPRENFADKWQNNPGKREAFYAWLQMARDDFELASNMTNVEELVDTLSPRMGRTLVESAANKRKQNKGLLHAVVNTARAVPARFRKFVDAPHRASLKVPTLTRGSAHIPSVKVERNGFRPDYYVSDDRAIPKKSGLTFEVKTDIAEPYKVYWQVVNTGTEARQARDMRGELKEGTVTLGKAICKERTAYTGSHSVQCFIVKDGYCVAKTEPFIVNIA